VEVTTELNMLTQKVGKSAEMEKVHDLEQKLRLAYYSKPEEQASNADGSEISRLPLLSGH
jgi:hypothetical protein